MVSNERGFTIVELIVAVTIFTYGLLSLLVANMLIVRLLAEGDRAATASFYARERLETMRGIPCADLADGADTRGGVYDLEWDIEEDLGQSVRRVQLLVTYPGTRGTVRTDTLESSVLCVG